jgi:hypothetical protein
MGRHKEQKELDKRSVNVLYVATLAMKLEREAPKRQDRIPSIVNIHRERAFYSLSLPELRSSVQHSGPGGGAYHRSL